MKDKRRTLIPALPPGAWGSFLAGLMSLTAVALVALGAALIYVPAGFITAGVGLLALELRFFGGTDSG